MAQLYLKATNAIHSSMDHYSEKVYPQRKIFPRNICQNQHLVIPNGNLPTQRQTHIKRSTSPARTSQIQRLAHTRKHRNSLWEPAIQSYSQRVKARCTKTSFPKLSLERLYKHLLINWTSPDKSLHSQVLERSSKDELNRVKRGNIIVWRLEVAQFEVGVVDGCLPYPRKRDQDSRQDKPKNPSKLLKIGLSIGFEYE
ncbi:hypothetical protein Fmac_014887 [Flemingia macrophylla]|uniref:Ribosomal protein S4 n=1 Tax=Flemingia macrophylla TaxID=520843 RepID=A0ABD1MD25_9FABA